MKCWLFGAGRWEDEGGAGGLAQYRGVFDSIEGAQAAFAQNPFDWAHIGIMDPKNGDLMVAMWIEWYGVPNRGANGEIIYETKYRWIELPAYHDLINANG